MAFDREKSGDNNRRSRNFSNGNRSGSGQRNSSSNSNGRIENFEKPLIKLLTEINEKLDILINEKNK